MLVPVTVTSMVEPSSAATTVYVDDVAPEIAAQFAPFTSQSDHW